MSFPKSVNDFSLVIEKLKIEKNFDTYTETVAYYYENLSDHDMTDIVKRLNNKIIERIRFEAEESMSVKVTSKEARLF